MSAAWWAAALAWSTRAAARICAILDRNSYFAAASLLLFITITTVASLVVSHATPLWHDEIYTVTIAGLPTVQDVWRALLTGVDTMPPLNVLLTHAVGRWLPLSVFAARLPSLISYIALLVIVFALVRRRANVLTGLSAAAIAALSGAFAFSYDARGYTLALAAAALALFAWAEGAEGRRRVIWLPVFAVSLAAAAWAHYFSLAILLPIVAGEIVRTRANRKIDIGVCMAIAGAEYLMAPLQGLLTIALAEGPITWRQAHWSDLTDTYRLIFGVLLGRRFLLLALVVTALCLAARWAERQRSPTLPPHEIVAGLTALAIPVFTVATGAALNTFVPRYAFAGVIGLSVVLPLAAWKGGEKHGATDLVLCLGLMIGLLQTSGLAIMRAAHPVDPSNQRPALVRLLNNDAPVVVTGLSYLEQWYYSPPAMRARMVYVADPSESLRLIGSSTVDEEYLALSRIAPIHVVSYKAFVLEHPAFSLYVDGNFAWLRDKLHEQGAQVVPRGQDSWGSTYDVSLSQQP